MPRDTPYAGVASIFRSAVARGEAPRVYEDGRQTRDFVHVRDVARANVAALGGAGAGPRPLNVASGTPRTVLDVAEAICAGTGIAPVVVGGGRLGDVRHVVASPERAAARPRASAPPSRSRQRKSHGEPAPVGLVAHGDGAVLGLDEPPGDGQAEAGPPAGARGAGRASPR